MAIVEQVDMASLKQQAMRLIEGSSASSKDPESLTVNQLLGAWKRMTLALMFMIRSAR